MVIEFIYLNKSHRHGLKCPWRWLRIIETLKMIRNQVVDPLFPKCPIRNVLSRIGDRWSLLVLLTLQDNEHPIRFRDLCKAIPDVSQKMLTSTLRALEGDDLIKRTAYPEVPSRVEYEAQSVGSRSSPCLTNLLTGHWRTWKPLSSTERNIHCKQEIRERQIWRSLGSKRRKSRHHLYFAQMIPAQHK